MPHDGTSTTGKFTMANSAQSASPPGDNNLSEWSAARATVKRFDGYLNSLRSYGFTLVTGLLAVTGYLSSGTSSSLSATVKLGVSVAILVLVVTLAVLDSQYRSLQRGAVTRARILERYLNLDLTSAIAYFVRAGRFGNQVVLVYLGFASSTFVLAFTVLWWNLPQLIFMSLAFGIAVAIILLLGRDTIVALVDWSVDRKIVQVKTPVRVTFTSLMGEDRRVEFHLKCEVLDHDGALLETLANEDVRLRYLSSKSWLWLPGRAAAGLYEIRCEWTLQAIEGKRRGRGRTATAVYFVPGGPASGSLSWETSSKIAYHSPSVAKPGIESEFISFLKPIRGTYSLTVQLTPKEEDRKAPDAPLTDRDSDVAIFALLEGIRERFARLARILDDFESSSRQHRRD